MTAPVDPLAAIVQRLRAHAPLAALVDGRIYGARHPQADGRTVLGPCVIVTPAGGAPGDRRRGLPLTEIVMELRCWGGTNADAAQRAMTLWRAARAALESTNVAVGEAHLLWAWEADAAALLWDPDTDEPFVRSTARIAVADAPRTA